MIMAIDYGERHTGVAFSDISGKITGRTLVITEYTPRRTLDRLREIIDESKPEKIVIGYPKNMNGTLGPRAEKSELLASDLRDITSAGVILWDERLTTVDAHNILARSGKNAKKRKETVDAVAASLILEGYLASL